MDPIQVRTARDPTPVSKANRHFSNRSPDRVWDYVIVGSGMGGLTTAALLSRVGYRCLVLEQHYTPGGFTHTFKRKRWTWDVGVHAVGEVSDRAVLGRALADLTRDRVEWAPLGRVYDEFWFPDLRIDFPNSPGEFRENLVQAFPSESGAIDTYFDRTREVATAMRAYYLTRLLPPRLAGLGDRVFARRASALLAQSTHDELATISANRRLQTVLTAQWGYYGVTPQRSSWAIHALVARHFLHGGFYPVGGSARIADALMATIADADGWTRIHADVKEIALDGGAAVGVTLTTGETIRARRVVSAAGALNTVTRLLPSDERERPWAQSVARLRPSPAHVCLYLGFKGDIAAAGATAANQWFYETWDDEAALWNAIDPRAEAPVLYCSFPSLKDPAHDPGPDELHTGEVVTFVPYEMFARWREARWMRRGDEYEALKESLLHRMLEQFLRHMPGLRPMIAHAEISTPVSTEWFTRGAAGAIYGLEPTPARFENRWVRPRTSVRNLFLSGSDVATAGVMGAFVGGLLAGAAAEPRRVVPHLRDAIRSRTR